MKCLIFLCALGLVSVAFAGTTGHDRGCIWVLGRCSEECPEGTHSYVPKGGCGRKLPEATCDEPNPVLEEGMICDYSACYCDPPTVRDTATDKCVKLEDCPKKPEPQKE